ncbi:reverse transcriptase domain-containing protein [Tanacetum coccineum]
MEYSYALRLNFSNSNNDAEYEALLAGLRIDTEMQVKDIHAFVDSKLVANQVEGSYEAKGERMSKYREKVLELAGAFNRSDLDDPDLKLPRERKATRRPCYAEPCGKRLELYDGILSLVNKLTTMTLADYVRLDNQSIADRLIKDGLVVDGRSYLLSGATNSSEANGIIQNPKLELESFCFTFDLVPLSCGKRLYCLVGRKFLFDELRDRVVNDVVTQPKVLTSFFITSESIEDFLSFGVVVLLIAPFVPGVDLERKESMMSKCPLTVFDSDIASSSLNLGRDFLKWEMLTTGLEQVVAKAINLGYYWPFMHRDARELIMACDDCQAHASVPRLPKADMILVTSAWPIMKWGMDIVGPLPEGPGRVKFGLPATIITNNGTQFVNDPFKKWAEKLKIQLISTLVYHPQGNKAVERANRSLLRGIKTRLEKGGSSWAEEELRLNLDLLDERREIVAIREAYYKKQVEKYYNKKMRHVQFKVGDFVLRKNEASRAANIGKLGPTWEGPLQDILAFPKWELKAKAEQPLLIDSATEGRGTNTSPFRA